jgi:DNA-binding beta-propeller fold protein YncE
MAWGTPGRGEGQFDDPHGIAVDGSGNVYVADTNNHRIQSFTPEGVFLSALGEWGIGEGQLSRPQGVAVDEQGHVHVADTGNSRIQHMVLRHTITVIAGEHGSISPGGETGEVLVSHGADQTFTITPDDDVHNNTR